MYRLRLRCFLPVVLGGAPVWSQPALALEVEPGVGAGLEYTDNAALTPDNEDSDLIAIGYVGAKIEQDSGPLQLSAATSLSYNHYTEDTYSDKHYFNLGANAGWDMVRDRFEWQLQDYYTQRSVDSLNADTPSNTENTNVFTFGPNLYFPLSQRQRITLRPSYRNFYYEVNDTDNQQYALLASWVYQMYRTLSVGLDGGVTRVEYDDNQFYPPYTSSNLQAVLSGRRVRSEYTLNLGATAIDRHRSDNTEGFTGNLTWQVDLTGRSSVRTYVGSELRDSSVGLLNASTRPEDGDFSNEQISGDVLRDSTARVTYSRRDSTLNSSVWGELREFDYKETPQDRDVESVGLDLDYRMSALLSSGVYGSYSRVKETDADRTDKNYLVGGRLSYRLSRKLRSVLDIGYREKDSTLDTQEYSELSALVSLVYGYGEVPRSSRSRGY